MNNINKQFTVLENNPNLCYLDSAASALKPKCVIDKINDYYNNYSCNIDRGVYPLSFDATKICDESRNRIAKFINAKENEIVFTRGASNSLNMIASMMKHYLSPGDEVITSLLEHHSSFLPFLKLQEEIGIKLVFVELDKDLKITVDNFKKAITPKTKFVQLTQVSNVTGYHTPIDEIVKIAHQNNILVSVDGAQGITHLKQDMVESDYDFYSFSLHKMCGPTGLGILYAKEELLNKLEPAEFGGEMNDEVTMSSVLYKAAPHKFETGTMPIAEMFASGTACEFIESIGYDYIESASVSLRNKAILELKKIPEIEIYNPLIDQGSTTIAFNIKGVHSHDAITSLVDSISLRAGHHCCQNLHTYLNIPSSLRASFYFYNDIKDVETFIKQVKETVSFFKEVGLIG